MELTFEEIALIRQSLKENARQFDDVHMKFEANECRTLLAKFTELRNSRNPEIKVVR